MIQVLNHDQVTSLPEKDLVMDAVYQHRVFGKEFVHLRNIDDKGRAVFTFQFDGEPRVMRLSVMTFRRNFKLISLSN